MPAHPAEAATRPVAALVVTYNAELYIADCLHAAWQAGVDELVVVDNASTDATVRVIREGPFGASVKVIESPENVGFAAGVNLAASQAPKSMDILLLNPDCRLSVAALSALKDELRRDRTLGAVAPAMELPGRRRGVPGGSFPSLLKELIARTGLDERISEPSRLRIANVLRSLRIGKAFSSHVQALATGDVLRTDWVSGFCMLVRRDVWDVVGGLDDRFFLYFEDVAFCKRVAEIGLGTAVLGQVVAPHDESASAKKNSKSSHYRRAMWKYFALYGTPFQRVIARAVTRIGIDQ